eukprot:3409611-Karenia_brevis.AAC.1
MDRQNIYVLQAGVDSYVGRSAEIRSSRRNGSGLGFRFREHMIAYHRHWSSSIKQSQVRHRYYTLMHSDQGSYPCMFVVANTTSSFASTLEAAMISLHMPSCNNVNMSSGVRTSKDSKIRKSHKVGKRRLRATTRYKELRRAPAALDDAESMQTFALRNMMLAGAVDFYEKAKKSHEKEQSNKIDLQKPLRDLFWSERDQQLGQNVLGP